MNKCRRRLARRRRAERGIPARFLRLARGDLAAARGWAALSRVVTTNSDRAEDAPAVHSGDGWEGRIEGFCPVQGHGVVDGRGWYFRARHDAWSFEVWESGPLPSDGHGGYRLPTESADWWLEGDDDDASWMRFSVAWGLIEAGIAAWRARPAPPEEP